MNSQLQQLIDAVKHAAPSLWAAAQQQVTALLVTGIVGCIVAVVSAMVLGRLGFYSYKKIQQKRDSDWDIGMVFAVIGSVGGTVWALACLFTTLPILLAPQYQAIHQLTNLSPVK